MAYHDAPNAFYCKQRNKGQDYATGNYGHRGTTVPGDDNKENKWRIAPCATYKGYLCKTQHHQIMLAQMEL